MERWSNTCPSAQWYTALCPSHYERKLWSSYSHWTSNNINHERLILTRILIRTVWPKPLPTIWKVKKKLISIANRWWFSLDFDAINSINQNIKMRVMSTLVRSHDSTASKYLCPNWCFEWNLYCLIK